MLIGEPAEGGLTRSLGHAFDDLGWEVIPIGWGPWRPAPVGAAAFRFPLLGAPFRLRLRAIVSRQEPDQCDLVLVVKGALLDARTVRFIRGRAGAPVFCWNPDSPFDEAISNRGAGIPQAIAQYDGYITFASDLADRVSDLNSRVTVIPFGCDTRIHFPASGDGRAQGRLVFVGTWTLDRERWLRQLAKWEPLVFGNDWPNISGLDVRPPAISASFRQVVGEASWNLNFLRPQNRLSHNMRSFEIPACGGRQLAQYSSDQQCLLDGTSSVFFKDIDELVGVLEGVEPIAQVDGKWLVKNTYASRVATMLSWAGLREDSVAP